MARFGPYNSFFWQIIAVLFLLNTPSSGGAQSLVDQICSQFGHSADRAFCLAFYRQYPAADIKGLTRITVLKTLAHATDTGNYIVTKIRSSGNGTELQNLYRDCQATYNNLVGQFTKAQFAIFRGDYASMKADIRDCERTVTGCQNAMGTRDGNLATQNTQNLALVKMSITSGNMIK